MNHHGRPKTVQIKPKTNVDMVEQTEDGELAVTNDESIEPTKIPKITVTLGNDAWIRILTKIGEYNTN